MGYLKFVFDAYYESDDEKEKKKLKKGFYKILWESLPYKKIDRSFRYKVIDDKIEDAELRELFKEHSIFKYKRLKSRYNINKLCKEDLIRARINSNYGKYCDKEVYLGKDYYKYMGHIRNIYFNYINGEYENPEQAKQELTDTYNKAMQLKEEAESNKLNITWEEYQKFIEQCLDRIFENYVPFEENDEWEDSEHWDWDEDNAVLRYVNVSLNGYLKNLIRDSKKPKEKFCQECGGSFANIVTNQQYCKDCQEKKAHKEVICSVCEVKIEKPKPRQKYCDVCKIKVEKEKHKNRQKKYREKKKVTI